MQFMLAAEYFFHFVFPGVTSVTMPVTYAFWGPPLDRCPSLQRLWKRDRDFGLIVIVHDIIRQRCAEITPPEGGNSMDYFALSYHAPSWKPQLYDARKDIHRTHLTTTVEFTINTKTGLPCPQQPILRNTGLFLPVFMPQLTISTANYFRHCTPSP